jgi:hypothetical protein
VQITIGKTIRVTYQDREFLSVRQKIEAKEKMRREDNSAGNVIAPKRSIYVEFFFEIADTPKIRPR